MFQWTIGRRILAMAAILCVLICVIAGWALYGIREIEGQGRAISEKSLPAVINTGAMNYLLTINMIRQYQLLNASTPEERKAIVDASLEDSRQNKIAVENYEATIKGTDERAEYDKFLKSRAQYVKVRSEYTALLDTNREEARKLLAGPLTEAFKEFSKDAHVLLDHNGRTGAQAGVELVGDVRRTSVVLIVASLISIVVGVVYSLINTQSINRRLMAISSHLGGNAEQVVTAAVQVSASSSSLAEGASEQASSLEETSSSMEEMSSMVQTNDQHTQEARELAQETLKITTENSDQVLQLRDSVSGAQTSSKELTVAIEEIKTSSNSISQIIKTIDEIAFQTNILALNAAVEAARAGDAGMGFAVVADEVRNLAKRSAGAAKETAVIIEDSIRKGDAGVRVNEDVVKKLSEIEMKSRNVEQGLKLILEKTGKVTDAVAQIATASREQTQGISQVNSALTQMDKVTQSNAASAEQTASAAQMLNSQAGSLQESVADLVLLVAGRTQTPTNAGATVAATSFKRKETAHVPKPAAALTVKRSTRASAAREADSTFKDDFQDMSN